MNNIQKLQEVLGLIDYPVLISVEDCIFLREGDNISWNTDDNFVELMDGDGDTYSAEMVEGCHEQDGYLITNIDTDQGFWETKVFKLDNEVFND